MALAAILVGGTGAAWADVSPKLAALSKSESANSENGPTDPNRIHASAELRAGVLPNGVRYVLVHNDQPLHEVSVRLVLDAGAYDEDDNERGAAHFVEHMAFAGAHGLNTDTLSRTFESASVEFGRDVNASTELYRTNYKIDLPTADPAGLGLAFRWLRSVADGTDFDEKVVDRERGVLLAERLRRMTPDREAAEAVLNFQSPDARIADRAKLEGMSDISALDAARLKAFHDRWYRPDRAVVIVVGDMPLAEMGERVRAAFSSWTAAPGPPPSRRPLSSAATRAEDVMVLAETITLNELLICRTDPAPEAPLDDVGALKREVFRRMWVDVLNRRLTRRMDGAAPPFLRATVTSDTQQFGFTQLCLKLEPIGDDWRAAETAAEVELKGLAGREPTKVEIAAAMEHVRSAYWYETDTDRKSPDVADFLATKTLKGEPVPEHEEAMRVFDLATDYMPGGETAKAFARDWPDSRPLIAVVAATPPTAAEVRSTWDAGQAAAPTTSVEARLATWPYMNFGGRGRVVKREVETVGDFVRLTYANGAVLNFKPTQFPGHDVEVRVRFGAGRQEIPNGQYVAAKLGSAIFSSGGLGLLDSAEIGDVLVGRRYSAKLSLEDDAFVLSGVTFGGDLRVQLQVLAAYMTDPGFRPTLDARLPTAIGGFYRMMDSEPALALSETLDRAVSPDSPNLFPLKPGDLHIDTSQLRTLLSPALREAPVEVTIVGNIAEEEAIDAVATTFGALPERKDSPRERADTWFLRFPHDPVAPVHISLAGPQKAMVEEVWPLFVADTDRRRDEYAVRVLSRVLRDALISRVRFELGKSYTPVAAVVLHDRSDEGYLAALVDASPADIDLVRKEVDKTTSALAAGAFDQAALDEARRPLLAQLDAKANTVAWWAKLLDGSARRPGDVAEALAAHAAIEALTLADVKAAAARWLSRPPIVLTATPATSP